MVLCTGGKTNGSHTVGLEPREVCLVSLGVEMESA